MSKDHRWNESKYPRANNGCLNQGLDIDGWGSDRNDYRYYNNDYNDDYYDDYYDDY